MSDAKNTIINIVLDRVQLESRNLYNEIFGIMANIQNNYENIKLV